MIPKALLATLVAAQLTAAQQSSTTFATVTQSGSTTTATAGSGTGEACFSVSSLLASYSAANPSATAPPFLAYDVAKSCALSAPIVQDDAISLIDGLAAMLEFQSDLGFKANPPSDYLLAPVDLLGELQNLRDAVQSGAFKSELEFQTNITTLFGAAHDGHLSFIPDAMTVFGYSRQFGSLVSLSLDGREAPKIYYYEDVYLWVNGNGSEPSAIAQIDGQDAVDFVLQQQQNTTFGSFQDPDALYNAFFVSYQFPVGIRNNPGLFESWSLGDPGASTSLTFENGTTVELENYAVTSGDFENVVDGESFYNRFLNATAKAEKFSASATATTTATTSATAAATPTQIMNYPLPIVISSDASASGYFLDEPGFEDTAVLALRSMSEEDPESFQETITTFLDACRSSNKTRLVLDITGNSGGTVALGYDTFKQLFPTLEPYGAGNYRAHRAFELLGETVTESAQEVMQSQPDNYTAFEIAGGTTNFAATTYLNASAQFYTSFEEFYGPVTTNPDRGNYTNLQRFDISNPDFDESFGSIVISGYANESNVAPQPFESENIIILSDGQCSSTCTILTHFLKYQAKVKSIAMGGRPTNTGAMQAVGGIKGSQVYYLSTLVGLITQGYQLINQTVADTWAGTALETLSELGDYVATRTASAGAKPNQLSFNFKNNIAENDTTYTPLQFVYEAADCRLYYQPQHFFNITNQWTSAAANAFGLNGTQVFEQCVAGSTNQPSSLSGNADLYNNGVPTNVTDFVQEGTNGSSANGQQNAGARLSVPVGVGLAALAVFALNL